MELSTYICRVVGKMGNWTPKRQKKKEHGKGGVPFGKGVPSPNPQMEKMGEHFYAESGTPKSPKSDGLCRIN